MGIAFDCVGTDEWHVVDDDLPQSQSKTSLILDPANDKAVANLQVSDGQLRARRDSNPKPSDP